MDIWGEAELVFFKDVVLGRSSVWAHNQEIIAGNNAIKQVFEKGHNGWWV